MNDKYLFNSIMRVNKLDCFETSDKADNAYIRLNKDF